MDDTEKPVADTAEQAASDTEDEETGVRDPEAPEADVVEQHQSVRPHGAQPKDTPPDADPADAWEQSQDVGDDDDDYR